jgi:hypothetical protein
MTKRNKKYSFLALYVYTNVKVFTRNAGKYVKNLHKYFHFYQFGDLTKTIFVSTNVMYFTH